MFLLYPNVKTLDFVFSFLSGYYIIELTDNYNLKVSYMNISEISNGSEVKIHASISGHSLVLMTEAIFGVSAGLLVKPMEYFGKYMQFLEPSKIEIKDKRNGRVYKFMSTTITPVKTRYGNFHLIRSTSELVPENSRKAERFSIEKLGLLSVNDNTKNLVNCIVHDVSMRGMSVILDWDTKCRIGDRLAIMFRYGPMLHSYEVRAVVVRYFTVKGMRAVGCSISNMNVDLIELLATKRKEKYAPEEVSTETNLNPEVSEKQQILDVEEDLASQLKSLLAEKPKERAITDTNPFAPDRLEHIQTKTLREQKKEERQAQQAREIDNVLDLKDL